MVSNYYNIERLAVVLQAGVGDPEKKRKKEMFAGKYLHLSSHLTASFKLFIEESRTNGMYGNRDMYQCPRKTYFTAIINKS